MAWLAALWSVATYVPKGEAAALRTAAAFSLASLGLLIATWRHLPRCARSATDLVVAPALFALAMLASRWLDGDP